ncbi:hypothetical protein ACFQ1L_35630 [Phytohabitans flavus]
MDPNQRRPDRNITDRHGPVRRSPPGAGLFEANLADSDLTGANLAGAHSPSPGCLYTSAGSTPCRSRLSRYPPIRPANAARSPMRSSRSGPSQPIGRRGVKPSSCGPWLVTVAAETSPPQSIVVFVAHGARLY